MHVLITLMTILAVWIRRDYRNWKEYHTTMLYIAVGNLMYNFLAANHLLWKFNPDILSNHTLSEVFYTCIVFPGTALMFLSKYPNTTKRIILHYITWIGVYVGFEIVFLYFNKIYYQFGWHLGWSALFDCIMFPMLRLFYKKPLLAYVLSVPIAVFFIWYFDVPVHIPMEDRLEYIANRWQRSRFYVK
jgi:hypothetical protein